MYPELFTIGPCTLYSYGLMMFLGVGAALLVLRALASRSGVDPWRIAVLGIVLAFVGYLGTSLLHVLSRLWFEGFRSEVAWQAMTEGALIWYGALVFGMPFAWYYMRRNGLPVWRTFDILMTGLPLGHAVGRIGCFLGGCCYGRPTAAWVGLRFPAAPGQYAGITVHPTQLYEAGGLLLIFFLLLRLFRTRRFDGEVFLAYLLLYAVLKAVVDAFRGDPTRQLVIHGAVSTTQLISAAMVLLAITVHSLRLRQTGGSG